MLPKKVLAEREVSYFVSNLKSAVENTTNVQLNWKIYVSGYILQMILHITTTYQHLLQKGKGVHFPDITNSEVKFAK